MKRSDELKLKRSEKVVRMQAILDGATTASRAVTQEENTEFTNLKSEVTALDAEIENAEFVEVRNVSNPAPQVIKRASNVYNVSKAIREFARGGEAALTGMEAEQHQELSRGVSSSGLLIPFSQRAANTTTNATNIENPLAPELGISILGKEPLFQSMGCTILPGLQGSFQLAKKAADVAGKYAEEAEITGTPAIPTYVTMSPARYGITETWSKELLAQENPTVHAAILADMVKSVDRKLTAQVYAVALAAASAVTAGALTAVGLDALMAAIEVDGAFAMDRGSFFGLKAVKLDAGSGKFLAAMGPNNGIGVTHDGANIYYSTLFADGTNQQYVIYGAWSEIFIGMYGGLELLIDPYTLQATGQIRTTVNKLAGIVCRDAGAFVKSPDLDAAT